VRRKPGSRGARRGHAVCWLFGTALGASALAGALVLPAGAAQPAAAEPAVGNGIGSLTPAQALAASGRALAAVPNLVIDGTLTENGAALGLDVESESHGRDAAGTIVSKSGKMGFVGTVKFISLPNTLFLDGGPTFWKGILAGSTSGLTAAQRARLLGLIVHQWIELTRSDARSFAGDLGALVKPGQLAASLTSPNGTLSKGAAKVIRGVPALPIISSNGGTLWLALSGPPLPVELSGRNASTSGALAFAYPATLAITAPANFKTLAQIEAAVA
jgi:hypothetical protein